MPGVRSFNRKHGNIFRKKSQLSKNTTAIKKLKANSHQEMNVHDREQASTAITDAGTLFPLCLIAQGLDLDDRTGAQVRIKSIDIRGRVTGNASATLSVIRIILLRSNNGITSAPAVEDVLQSASVYSHYEAVTQQRSFHILSDRTYAFDFAVANRNILFRIKRKPNTRMDFSLATAVEAATNRGSYYLLVIGDEVTNDPSVQFTSRVLFTTK